MRQVPQDAEIVLQILVVEDQDGVRNVMAEVIEEIGIPVLVEKASSLSEARGVLSRGNIDAMVTDLSLGDGQSLELIDELRTQGNNLPIMLVSGFLSEERIRRANELGVNRILPKPFLPQTLIEFLQDSLDIEVLPAANDEKLKLLPHMFQMDRNISLLFRMLTEMPRYKEVSEVCVSTLELALEVVHGKRGYLAFHERDKEEVVIVSSQEVDAPALRCKVKAAAFEKVLNGQKEVLFVQQAGGVECWPDVVAGHYVLLPVTMEDVPVGILCLADYPGPAKLETGMLHMLKLLLKNLDTLLDNRAVHAALADSMRQTLFGLVRSLEARDRYTKDHSMRVSELSVKLARELRLDEDTVELIKTGALMHDIGKVGIADEILLKKGRFTEHEYRTMQAHPAIGDSILKNMDALALERLIVRHHHERWDGQGYPDRLQGEGIPLSARIVCVADAIDAMTSRRCYRTEKPVAFCRTQLEQGAGSQFDPQVVEAAIALIDRGDIEVVADSDAVL